LENLEFLNFEKEFKVSLNIMGQLIAHHFAGTSGPLYGAFLSKGKFWLFY